MLRNIRPADLYDWATTDGSRNFYGVAQTGDPTISRLWVMNSSNVQQTVSGLNLRKGNGERDTGPWGAVYAAGGFLYAGSNDTGRIYRVDPQDPSSAALFSQGSQVDRQ